MKFRVKYEVLSPTGENIKGISADFDNFFISQNGELHFISESDGTLMKVSDEAYVSSEILLNIQGRYLLEKEIHEKLIDNVLKEEGVELGIWKNIDEEDNTIVKVVDNIIDAETYSYNVIFKISKENKFGDELFSLPIKLFRELYLKE